jgi:hypothetical protein
MGLAWVVAVSTAVAAEACPSPLRRRVEELLGEAAVTGRGGTEAVTVALLSKVAMTAVPCSQTCS